MHVVVVVVVDDDDADDMSLQIVRLPESDCKSSKLSVIMLHP